jgi:hypothetical protein
MILSQFRFNLYFLDLLIDYAQLRPGSLEIIVKPGLRPHLAARGPLPKDTFTRLIGSMFLAEPPCKTVGIYVPNFPVPERVAKIHDAGGIRVGHFLSTLEDYSGQIIDIWKSQAQAIRKDISDSPLDEVYIG